jgi:hypothetical protein
MYFTVFYISGNNFITYKKKKTNLVIFNAGKNFRSKIRSCYKTICPHGVPPGMFSVVIVEISAESVKACSFHQRKSIPDTEIIDSTSFRYNRFANSFFPQLYRNLPQYPCCSIQATDIKIDK